MSEKRTFWVSHGYGLNIKSNVFNHTRALAFNVPTLLQSAWLCIDLSLCEYNFRIHLYGSIVFIDGTIYMHTGCVCNMIVIRKWMRWWRGLYSLSFLPHFKIPTSHLAYLNPKSYFMHRRFESKCSIFPLSRFTSYTRSVVLSVYFYQPLRKNRNKFFGCYWIAKR